MQHTCEVDEVHLGAQVLIGGTIILVTTFIPLWSLFVLLRRAALLDCDGEDRVRAGGALIHACQCCRPAP